MDDTFKIFVHRLKVEREEKIEEVLAPDFLQIQEHEILFEAPIYVKGVASVTDEMLILRLSIETEFLMPCAICNQNVVSRILIPNFYFTQPLEQISSGIFDYQEILREEILLEIPYKTECHSGDCPERATMAKYLTK